MYRKINQPAEKTVAGSDEGRRISVILPVFNEAALVKPVFDAVLDFAQRHTEYEFLFVDDASTDDTAGLLSKRIEEAGLDCIRLMSYQPNGGKGLAICRGIEATQGDLVIFTDGDLAYSLDHLPVIANALKLNDVVIGSRSLVESGQHNIKLTRRFMGWVFNRLARLILHLPYRDTQAGLKGFTRVAAHEIVSRQRLFDFSFDVEMVYIARTRGFRIGEVAARVADHHSYKISTVNIWRDPLRMFLALWKVRINSWRGLYRKPA